MKLVDILSRELTEWAGDVGAITQDKLTGELLDYYHCPLRGGNEREVSSIADDAGEAHDGASGAAVTRAEWQAAVDALNAPKVVEWDGVGLPPVGVVCEYVDRCKFTRLVEVLAFNQDEAWLRSIGSECESHSFTTKYLDAFSPIRTAEQVAAEERDAKAKELYLTINWNDVGSTWDSLVASRKADYLKAIDAGYRKEPKSCGS